MTQAIAAITLHEPYASLVALRAKRFETRSWQTHFRGLIAIHAGKSREATNAINADLIARRSYSREASLQWMIETERGRFIYHCGRVFRAAGIPNTEVLPFGCVVAIARLVACHRTESLDGRLSEQERFFGNFAPKRFAWELEIVKVLPVPARASGQQGIWSWPLPDSLQGVAA